ncbi:MAG: cell division ATP-binding protein FtsE [Gammaproteobacteria bacterium]|nr:MAG: cell division ATP-binding protein FtsE [Gammaproteobacteria bacterium]
MIVFDRVSKRYSSGQDALLNISFRLGRGEMAFLTGHSGAGKSTLLKLIMAMETASGGRIEVGGRDVSQLQRNQIAFYRRHVGVVFQEHHLLFNRTVFDNVAMPLRIAGFTPRETARRVRAALDKVGLLRKEKAYPLELSGGEQQRVGIARAVVNRPPLLLADEPTGNLDPDLSAEIMQLFRDFNQVGTTVFIASHDIALIERMGCRVVHLENGRLVSGGQA